MTRQSLRVTHNNKDYFSAGSNEERTETERKHQDKLEANRYAAFIDRDDDNWSMHAPQYVEREEKPERMRKNGSATKRHAPKGLKIIGTYSMEY